MKSIVIGGSIAGLVGALALGRAGHEAVILDADTSEAPGEMGPETQWFRQGTPHSRQAHAFLSLFVKTLSEQAPEILTSLLSAGAVARGIEELMPPSIEDRSPRPGDEDLVVVGARRPLVEWILRRALLVEPSVEFRPSSRVSGLVARQNGAVPHVTGVRTEIGEVLTGDVVIDASGRGSQVASWLEEIGARPAPLEQESCHQIYFGRYYRLIGNEALPPLNNGFVSVSIFPWCGVLMFPGDNGVLQLAVGTLPEDREMKQIRRPEAFQAMARMAPGVAEWVDPALSKPITDVGAMGRLDNHLRRLMSNGEPVVTGLHLVGDSASITNPQYGRGVSHAVGHAVTVVKVLTEYQDDPSTQAMAVDAEVTRMLEPSFRNSVRQDRMRTFFWRAALGMEQPPDTGTVAESIPVSPDRAGAAMAVDPIVWRAVARSNFLLDPPGSWAKNEEVLNRISKADLPESSMQLPSFDEIKKLRGEVLEEISKGHG